MHEKCFVCNKLYTKGYGYYWTHLGHPDIVDDYRHRICNKCIIISREELKLKLEEKILLEL
jgi:hypothetical protein